MLRTTQLLGLNGYEQKPEIDCFIKVVKKDGLKGFLFRGLDATLAREIPGYGLYFVIYFLLMQSTFGLSLGIYLYIYLFINS